MTKITSHRKSRLGLWVLIAITSVLVVFACIEGAFLYRMQQHNIHASQQWAQQQTQKIATDIAQKMQQVSDGAGQLADSLSNASCSPCNIEATLRDFYLKNSAFASIGVAFNAGRSGTEFRLYAPFIRNKSTGATLERLDSYYDYQAYKSAEFDNLLNNPEHWFNTAQHRERQWLAPFYENALSTYVLRYTLPVYDHQKQKIGLVFVDISLEWLAEQIGRYDLKDNNYLSLHTAQGSELYHSFKSVQQIVKSLTNTVNKSKDVKSSVNSLTGDAVWSNNQKVAGTDWLLDTTISKNTPLDDYQNNLASNPSVQAMEPNSFSVLTEDNKVAWVFLLVAISILFFSCLRLLRNRTTELQLWIDTAVYTFIFCIGVIAIWVFEYGTIIDRGGKSTILANKAIVEKYERDYAMNAVASHDKAPTYIPVGLFIQSIEFLSASNVSISGYIWHRYAKGQESNYKVGTVFPEAIVTNINLAYEEETNDEVIKGWYFETTLRENFTPDRYPLDRQSVWIRLWHEKLGDNIILVPDFKSYNSLSTRALPGIEKDFVLSGWSLFRSYFEMRENVYNTRIGRVNGTTGDAVPELYFNIEIMRNFINPFLAFLFPLLVVVLMLYAIVITMSTNNDRKEFLGFNAAGVIASCSALFFVALIAHVQMRNELAANSVVYLEYFYLITYFIILLITTNAVLLSLRVQLKFIQFHDNLLPKLMYWPALSGALFLCTLWTFR